MPNKITIILDQNLTNVLVLQIDGRNYVLQCNSRSALADTFKAFLGPSAEVNTSPFTSSPIDFLHIYEQQCKYLQIKPLQEVQKQCKEGTSFQVLNLRQAMQNNSIHCTALSEGFRWNSSLTTVDLGWNILKGKSFRNLCEVLSDNSTVNNLFINLNGLNEEDAAELAKYIGATKSLKYLNASLNQFGDN